MMRCLALSFLLLMLAACGTSPEPNYYDLTAVPGSVLPNTVAGIEIERPAIASYLDRPDIVRQKGDFQILIDEDNRWAEPPDSMIERTLTEDLSQRLPNSPIYSEADDHSHQPRFIIETTIDQFNAIEGRGVVTKGTISIHDKTGVLLFKPQTFSFEGEEARSLDGLASTLSNLVSQLADTIVAELRPTFETAPKN